MEPDGALGQARLSAVFPADECRAVAWQAASTSRPLALAVDLTRTVSLLVFS